MEAIGEAIGMGIWLVIKWTLLISVAVIVFRLLWFMFLVPLWEAYGPDFWEWVERMNIA